MRPVTASLKVRAEPLPSMLAARHDEGGAGFLVARDAIANAAGLAIAWRQSRTSRTAPQWPVRNDTIPPQGVKIP